MLSEGVLTIADLLSFFDRQTPIWSFVLGLYLAFGAAEILHAAESGHTILGRFKNVLIGALLQVAGGVVTFLALSLLPFGPPRTVDHTGPFAVAGYLVVYLFVTDFIFYWYHRAQHVSRTLWPLHELHHTDRELNATSSMRSFWLDRPAQTLCISVPLFYMVGVQTTAAAILPFVTAGWLIMTHANVRWEFGVWTRILCGPQVHRIHHSILPEHSGKNLAQIFPFIDIVFGTYHHPRPGEFPPTGVASLPGSPSVDDAVAKPFRTWVRIAMKNLRGSD